MAVTRPMTVRLARVARIAVLVVLPLLAASVLDVPVQDEQGVDNVTTWLPRDLRPLHYKVRIQPILREGNFTAPAELEFTFLARVATERVTVNVRDLRVDEDSVIVEEQGAAWTPLAVVAHEYNATLETYGVVVRPPLQPRRQYRLRVRYEAKVGDNLKGLYRVAYQDSNNNKRWMAMTQLHPTNARTMFPCMDEPQYKARFTLSVAREQGHTSLANMPLRATEPMEGVTGWVWDHFETSVPMSSYLIALAIFDFAKVEPPKGPKAVVGDDDVAFRVWARPSEVHRGAYAARIGPDVLRFYSDTFNISFPLPKQDMVATTRMTFNAMENWGLIFFREPALLVDDADPGSRHYVAGIVAHELAHQWFGNLVTMRWWNDVWLNEGFATYMSQLGVSHVEPQWQSEDMFVLDNMQGVMQTDALPSSHPVSREVYRVSDIDHIFDDVSYKKGSSVVRMMSQFLGQEAFQHGLNTYLRRHAYGSAAQDDLWAALTEAGRRAGTLAEDQSVKEIMDSWTLRTGFPVVDVVRDYCRGTASVSQRRFLVPGRDAVRDAIRDAVRGAAEDCCWGVPLWLKSSRTRDAGPVAGGALHWLQGRNLTLGGLPGSGHWLLVNGARAGYYRVNYDPTNWRLLTLADDGALSDLERAGLVDDALALAGAARLPYDVPVALMQRLPRDRASLAWVAALPWLHRISHLLHNATPATPATPASPFVHWTREVADDLLAVSDRLRDSTDPVEHAFSKRVRRWACGLGAPRCPHSPRLSGPVTRGRYNASNICKASYTKDEWNETLRMFFEENPAVFLNLAECLQSDMAAEGMLEIAFFTEETDLSPTTLLKKLAENPHSFDAVMQFLQNNWMRMQESHGTSYNNDIIKAIAPFVKTNKHIQRVQEILLSMEHDSSLPQSIDEGYHNLWWLQNQAEKLLKVKITR